LKPIRRRPLDVAAALLCGLAAGATPVATNAHPAQASPGAEAALISIAVFDFELDDKSAGGGIIALDDIDRTNLKQATGEAKRLLAATGRYTLIDTEPAVAEVATAHGVVNCRSCEVPIARRLGADQAAIGVITRVNRTEYTLFVRVTDTKSGAIVASEFTGLRMGANYAWPRGVTSLLNNSLLAKLLPH
jgi:hypothetical protein